MKANDLVSLNTLWHFIDRCGQMGSDPNWTSAKLQLSRALAGLGAVQCKHCGRFVPKRQAKTTVGQSPHYWCGCPHEEDDWQEPGPIL